MEYYNLNNEKNCSVHMDIWHKQEGIKNQRRRKVEKSGGSRFMIYV